MSSPWQPASHLGDACPDLARLNERDELCACCADGRVSRAPDSCAELTALPESPAAGCPEDYDLDDLGPYEEPLPVWLPSIAY